MCHRTAFESFWLAGREGAALTSKEADLAWTVWQAAYHTALQDVEGAVERVLDHEATSGG